MIVIKKREMSLMGVITNLSWVTSQLQEAQPPFIVFVMLFLTIHNNNVVSVPLCPHSLSGVALLV